MPGSFFHFLRRLQRQLLAGLALRFPGWAWLLPAGGPLVSRRHPWAAPGLGPDRAELLVFLPGIGDVPDDYEVNGFLDAVRRGGAPADMLAVDAHYGYYARRNVLERLRQDVIGPARTEGYQRIWLVGISLGGLGSLAYAAQHPEDLAGLVLLAPFVGHPGVIREVAAAGGARLWQPGGVAPDDYERQLWLWLKGYAAWPADRLPIYLGFGESDLFAPGNRLLAQLLPPARVVTVPGGHDWPTWKRLWDLLVAAWRVPGGTVSQALREGERHSFETRQAGAG